MTATTTESYGFRVRRWDGVTDTLPAPHDVYPFLDRAWRTLGHTGRSAPTGCPATWPSGSPGRSGPTAPG